MHAVREGTVHAAAEALQVGLRSLLRRGSSEPSDWLFHTDALLPELRRLGLSAGSTDESLAQALSARMREAIQALPPPQNEGASFLFGLDPDSRGQKLARRRARAARAFEVQPDSFRAHVERRLLDGLSQQLAVLVALEDPRVHAGFAGSADPRSVLIVHGRDSVAAVEVRRFLESLGLRPIGWTEAVQHVGVSTPSVVESLQASLNVAQAVVIVLEAGEQRQNVLFEAGLFLGLARSRTVLVQLGTHQLPSDFQGVQILQLRNSSASRAALRSALQHAGCATDDHAEGWLDRHHAGDLVSGWHRWTPEVATNPALADVACAVETFEPVQNPAGHAAAKWLTSKALDEHPSIATHLLVRGGRLEGFIALASGSVELTTAARRRVLPAQSRRSIHGATILHWLAKHRAAPRTVARELLLYATAIALDVSEQTGSIALVVEPFDAQDADQWCRNFGFIRLDKNRKTLWYPLSDRTGPT